MKPVAQVFLNLKISRRIKGELLALSMEMSLVLLTLKTVAQAVMAIALVGLLRSKR